MIYNEKNEYKYHHGHDHVNEVLIECDCKLNLCKDEETLKILLDHWVEHNESHEEGFKEWVQKAKSMGKLETAEFILKAIEFMQEADEMLRDAKKNM
ncbi:hypothetical protein [Clostridium magnum]|uniref:DUF8180 domain-containing protein n=1 Tax=Clostridium magnum DSM 2767 TaxID=1121326 RepID=A0A162SZT3_9CLOT|nr:hypothetical protein [Clostridium magnum]KZL92070.1 hypothetical protein CLMAG_18760 [Clostridium magnum DSM 2767]SHH23700.1 hypothetical protein SAMN02745944_00353 [Clostridium magnum DSM 2767]